MSDNVIPLGAKRQESTRPLEYDGHTCAKCGGAWFVVPIILDKMGHVTGNAAAGTCADCNEYQDLPIPPEVW